MKFVNARQRSKVRPRQFTWNLELNFSKNNIFLKKVKFGAVSKGFDAVYKGFGAVYLARFEFFLKKIYFLKKVKFGAVYKAVWRSLQRGSAQFTWRNLNFSKK